MAPTMRLWTTAITTTTIPARIHTTLHTCMAAMEAPTYTYMYATSGTAQPTTMSITAQSTASTRTTPLDITAVTQMETQCALMDGLVLPPTAQQVITNSISNYVSEVGYISCSAICKDGCSETYGFCTTPYTCRFVITPSHQPCMFVCPFVYTACSCIDGWQGDLCTECVPKDGCGE